METKFTKGEWKFDGLSLCTQDDVICIFYDDYGIFENSEANAKLIAAAPDLLEACLNSFKIFISIGSTMEADIMIQLENAIKKATE